MLKPQHKRISGQVNLTFHKSSKHFQFSDQNYGAECFDKNKGDWTETQLNDTIVGALRSTQYKTINSDGIET